VARLTFEKRDINGIHGRTWFVSRQWMRDMPAGVDEPFEHDVEGGRAGVILILSILVLLVFSLWLWFFPLDVVWPWWLWLPLVAVVAFFGIRWLFRRPWEIKAWTTGHFGTDAEGNPLGPETWIGTVRGVTKSRDEVRLITQAIRKSDSPEYLGGVLKKQDQADGVARPDHGDGLPKSGDGLTRQDQD
jgi:hypothetical protein